ncbi:ATP-binding cassette domain-containing protein [Leuconostoc falkenbergense]|uniref:ATP-binding cassette domain-containing protein n=1 Tax=Leuconostoc falkenbergense TaxID=2766470 RepID=UPI003896AFAF
MENEVAISVKNISKKFGQHVAVNDISFDVKKGEIFGLLGPNGAGKSTLINMMTTLMQPDQGEIMINGLNTISQSRQVRSQFSVTGQSATIDKELSARENLFLFGRLNGLNHDSAHQRSEELLVDFDLVQSADHSVSTSSGGMLRRLDLAISLIGNPSILFLDEPTTGLDPRTRTQMWVAIQKLVKNGTTVLLTTQYLEEADQLADRIALIDHGRLIAEDKPSELKKLVGGLQLKVTVEQNESVIPTQSIIEKVLGKTVNVENRNLTVILDNNAFNKVSEILDKILASKIMLSSFKIEAPSLDEVFLSMTVGKN